MQYYNIYTDSCADLDEDMLKKLEIHEMNMTFTLDGVDYICRPNHSEMAMGKFYSMLRQGSHSSTSQINTVEYLNEFRPLLASGQDVLYIGLSSGLSGTVNSAHNAAAELEEEFPGRRVVVVDSLAASMGLGLLVWYGAKMRQEGKTLNETAAWLEANKLKIAHWFTVDDLNFLKRGGRLSGTAAFVGTMLSIKPVLHVDNEGHLLMVRKIRGRKKSLLDLADEMEKSAINPGKQTVFISHGDAGEDAEFVAGEIRRRFGTKDIRINYIGPIVGGHSGPGTIALFFMAENRG